MDSDKGKIIAINIVFWGLLVPIFTALLAYICMLSLYYFSTIKYL